MHNDFFVVSEMSNMNLNGPEVKRRTIQEEAFGVSSARMGRYIAIEVLTDPFSWVPESP